MYNDYKEHYERQVSETQITDLISIFFSTFDMQFSDQLQINSYLSHYCLIP